MTKYISKKSILALEPRKDTTTEGQNRDISDPTKRTYVFQKFKNKRANETEVVPQVASNVSAKSLKELNKLF